MLLWGKRATDTRLYVRNSFTVLFLTETPPGQWTIPDVDLFCAGQTILPDGKVLIVGGTVNTSASRSWAGHRNSGTTNKKAPA